MSARTPFFELRIICWAHRRPCIVYRRLEAAVTQRPGRLLKPVQHLWVAVAKQRGCVTFTAKSGGLLGGL
jgi:hypothetical protein